MAAPNKLRNLDDRVLGDRFRRRPRAEGDTVVDGETETTTTPMRTPDEIGREVIGVVILVSQLVFVLLAVVVVLGMVFTAAPTNADNVIVRNVLERANDAAGPFKDIFTPEGGNTQLYANYATAAGVYLVLVFVLGKVRDRVATPVKKS